MSNFQHFSGENFVPKRLVFKLQPGSPERGSTEVEAFQASLKGFGKEVTEEQTRASLEDLRAGVELQDTARKQEETEVNKLETKLDTGLEDEPKRREFMTDLQLRLSVLLSILVNAGEISEDALAEGSIDSTFQSIKSQSAALKLGTDDQGRGLYDHEKKLLEFPKKLEGHKNAAVKDAWTTLKNNLKNNVNLMRAAGAALSDSSDSFSLTEETSKLLDAAKRQWAGLSPEAKTIAKVAGAVGSLWLLYRMFRGTSEGGKSSAFSILGIGALLAGGLYIAGKYMSFSEAMEKLKGQFSDLDPSKMYQGFLAYTGGNLEVARRYWGEHYEAVVASLRGEKGEEEKEDETPEESGEDGELPVDVALDHYYNDLRLMADPLVSYVEANDHVVWAAALTFPVLAGKFTLAALRTGKTIVSPLLKLLAFGVRTTVKHPFMTAMLVAAYFINKATVPREDGKPHTLPKDINGLKNKIKKERLQIAAYARSEHEWDTTLSDEQIDKAASVIGGEKTITQAYDIQPNEIKDMAVNAVSEGVRMDDVEKLRDRNQDGLADFRSTLHDFNERGNYTLFVKYLFDLRSSISTAFTIDQLEALKTEALKYGLTVWTEAGDGYIWWRRNDHPEEFYCCGINPGVTAQEQVEAAIRFAPNPDNLGSSFIDSLNVPLEEVREGLSEIVTKVSEGEYGFIFGGTKSLIWDGVQERYLKLPWNLATRIFKAMSGERFQAKEFLFDCAGGMVPVAVLGTALALPRFAANFMFKNAFQATKLQILVETAVFPITGPLKLGVSFGKRIVVPFGRGVLQGHGNPLNGFAEIYRKNMSDLVSTIRRMRYDRAHLTRLPDNLRVAFEKIIAYEDSITELSKLRSRSFKDMKDIRDILRKAREILTIDGNIPADEALRLIPEYTSDLTSKLPKVFKGEIIENLSKEIAKIERGLSAPAGISSADISRIMTVMNEAEEAVRLERSAADIARGLDAAAPEARAAARTARRAAAAAEAAAMSTRRAVISGDLIEMGRARAAVNRADDLARAVREAAAATDNAPVKIAAGNAASAAERTVELAREALQTARSQVAGATTEARRLSDLAISAVTPAREAASMASYEADAAARFAQTARVVDEAAARPLSFMNNTDGVRTSTMLDEVVVEGGRATSWVQDSLQSRRSTELFAEATAPVVHTAESLEGVSDAARLDMTLSDTLKAISKGKELEPEHLARVRLAVRDGASAEQIAAALRARGVTPAAVEAGLQALRQERHIGRLMQILDNLRILKFGGALRGLGKVALRCLSFRRVAQAAPPIVGVAVNVYLANAAWEMAKEFKENPELADLYKYKAKMFATAGFADLAIEGLIMAGKVGVKGNLILTAGVIALQYMVEGAIDAHAETLMGSNDYIRIGRENGIEELLLRWYTTGEDTNAGEEYDSVFTLGNRGQEYYGFHRAFTREKIIDALLALTSPGMTEDYILYRKNYIASQAYQLNVFNFQQGQQLLTNSMAFASIMEDRNIELAIQDPAETINLNDQRFDNQRISTEDINRIYKAGRNQLNDGIKTFLREAVGGNEAEAEQLFRRLKNLDLNYLSHSINMIFAYVSSDAVKTADQNEVEKWTNLSLLLVSFLQYEGVSLAINPEATVDANSMADMRQVFFNTRLNPLEVEALKGDFARPSAAVAALYEVAQFYGYQGQPHEEDLKRFFDERHEGMYGIYWKGNEWRTNELGRTTADSRHGSSIDEAVIAIINRFRAHPDRILESRHDYLSDELIGDARDDEVRRRDQIRVLAERMNNIYMGYEAPDLEYQRAYSGIPEEQRVRLHELMGDPSEGYGSYAMRRIVILYQKSLREPFDPRLETRSFRLWAQAHSPMRDRVLEYFNSRQNNFNMAGIEDRRMLSQLNTDLSSFDQVFEDLAALGLSAEEIDYIRGLYDQAKRTIANVIQRIDHQQIHPLNNPTWVTWPEISGAMNQLRELNDEYQVVLHDLGIMEYWMDNGERDKFRERGRRRAAAEATNETEASEVIDVDPEIIRAKRNINFEIDSLILMLNRVQVRDHVLETNYINALYAIKENVDSQSSLEDCMSVFRIEMEKFRRDFYRGFVGVDVVDVKKLWGGETGGGYSFGVLERQIDTIISRIATIPTRETREELVGDIPELGASPSDTLQRAKFNLGMEINYLKRELNRVQHSDTAFETEYLNRLNTIERSINAQGNYSNCTDTFKVELNNLFNDFIQPNIARINQVWGEGYSEVLVESFRSLVGITANIEEIARREPR